MRNGVCVHACSTDTSRAGYHPRIVDLLELVKKVPLAKTVWGLLFRYVHSPTLVLVLVLVCIYHHLFFSFTVDLAVGGVCSGLTGDEDEMNISMILMSQLSRAVEFFLLCQSFLLC